jgi:hypothetical protein
MGILFPIYWPSRFSARYRYVVDSIFAPDWMHILTHLILFAGLVILLVFSLKLHLRLRSAVMILIFVFWVGLGQELLQSWIKGFLGWGSIGFDLGVDGLGGALGLLVVFVFQRFRAQKAQNQ